MSLTDLVLKEEKIKILPRVFIGEVTNTGNSLAEAALVGFQCQPIGDESVSGG